ncbi:MAG: ATP-dependent transcriptional regulator, MalT-like, LuxR family [Mycobacterium sp.]|nr:ATP-dependent transcriptional regulator, MalT-like, LuxR family [Mycobacterium sp.]
MSPRRRLGDTSRQNETMTTASGRDLTRPLLGRRRERGALDESLEQPRAGTSAVLVVRGDPGVGKTRLLEYVAARASDFRVVRAAGVESEMELAYSGLHQLCAPLLSHVGQLPGPMREGLQVAFGMAEGDAPDRFLIGLGVLNLLAEVAEEQPLLCLIDDAQWLDRASLQTLGFVARRLMAEPVAILFAVRGAAPELGGLPDLDVSPLHGRDARALLSAAIPVPLDPDVKDRMVAEAAGNPLALLQLAASVRPGQLAGGFALTAPGPVTSRIEAAFLQQFELLPDPTRLLLLTGAAEPTGDLALLWRAAGFQGIPAGAASPAEYAGLAEFSSRVRFRHPLVRSAIYRAASPDERRAAHQALADATDPIVDPDRRAWHRAHATDYPDESIAEELESSAGRAEARGGLAAAASFLEKAAELTPDQTRRGERALAAGEAHIQAGSFDAAQAMIALAEAATLDELGRARVDLLYAQLAFVPLGGNDPAPLLLQAARRLEHVDVDLSCSTYREAMSAAMFSGQLAVPGGSPRDVAEAVRAAPKPTRPRRAHELLLDGLAANFVDGYAEAVPLLRRALDGLAEEPSAEEARRWLWLGSVVAIHLWDEARWDRLSDHHVQIARDSGALTELPLALTQRANLLMFLGELSRASALVDEVETVVDATGSALTPYGALAIASFRGNETRASALAAITEEEAVMRGEGIGLVVSGWLGAVLHNGRGNYEKALAAAEQGAAHPSDPSPAMWTLVELAEAAARTGSMDRAKQAVDTLVEMTTLTATDWGLGVQARSRALVQEGDAADSLYREAIERLGRTRMRLDLARAELMYGEWLRRRGSRTGAREHLRTAHNRLSEMGADGFAERARRELAAIGETVRTRKNDHFADLTAQETQVARLASEGHSNQEIGSKMYISPRTVEWHLGNVFGKLGVTSRKALRVT